MFKKKESQKSHEGNTSRTSQSSHASQTSHRSGTSGSVHHAGNMGNETFSTESLGNTFTGIQAGGFTPFNFLGSSETTPRLGLSFDIYQEGDSLSVVIPFPSLNPETLTIVQENRLLKVSGSSENFGHHVKNGHTRIPLFVQIPKGHFEQIINLPLAVQEDQAKATYENGVLTIDIKLIGSGRENRVPVSFA